MGPICPHCGHDDNVWCTAWDSGSPDYRPGSLCNGCGSFVANDEWEYEDDDEFERDRKEDIERAGRMFMRDEIEDDQDDGDE